MDGPSLEALEAFVAESQRELAHAQSVWEDRVRAGDEDPANLLFVAGKLVAAKRDTRELLASIALAATLDTHAEGRDATD